jgi:hypothetical protein
MSSSEKSVRAIPVEGRGFNGNRGFKYQTEDLVYHNYQLPKDIVKHGNPGEYMSR